MNMKYAYTIAFLGWAGIGVLVDNLRLEIFLFFISTICFIMAAAEVIIERTNKNKNV